MARDIFKALFNIHVVLKCNVFRFADKCTNNTKGLQWVQEGLPHMSISLWIALREPSLHRHPCSFLSGRGTSTTFSAYGQIHVIASKLFCQHHSPDVKVHVGDFGHTRVP